MVPLREACAYPMAIFGLSIRAAIQFATSADGAADD
jgi:hypothetical protein